MWNLGKMRLNWHSSFDPFVILQGLRRSLVSEQTGFLKLVRKNSGETFSDGITLIFEARAARKCFVEESVVRDLRVSEIV